MRAVVNLMREPLPLVVAAAVVGLLAPSERLAQRADLILAALVLAVALTISPRRLMRASARWRLVLVLTCLPLVFLLPLAVGLGLLFEEPERTGLLALGLASSEVATAGLVVIAGGDAALALAVVTLSLAASAAIAPVAAPILVDASVDPVDLVLRFSLVVLVPLAIGLAAQRFPAGRKLAPAGQHAAMAILGLLVYASLGDISDRSAIGAATLAATLFLACSAVVASVLRRFLGGMRTGPLVFTLRDFAVAAALATELGAPGAAATAAIYGVLMLVAAAAAASTLRRTAKEPSARS